jgi:hypothetical protein
MLLEKEVDPDSLADEPWQDGELLWYLYRQKDWTQRTIAYELEVDKAKVLRGLIENDILQPWQNKELLENTFEEHGSPKGVAEAWNCSELTIRRWLDEHGLKGRAELTEDLLREMYEHQRLTTEEIADDLGYAPVGVQMKLREHGISRRDGSHRFNNSRA